MARYFTRAATVHSPGFDWHGAYDQDFGRPSPVGSFKPTNTGILTSAGDCIMRAPNPIGFGRDEEW